LDVTNTTEGKPTVFEAAAKTSLSRAIKGNPNLILSILTLILILIFLASFTVGRYGIPLSELLTIFFHKIFGLAQTWTGATETVLFNIRIPRILIAMLIGAALSAAGASYQGLFRNPMVSPDILGASAGAGFGAAAAILMSASSLVVNISAFCGGIIAVGMTYIISRFIEKGNQVLVMVLTGIVVTSLFTALISLTKFTADPNNKLPEITFWLMGGLASITAKKILILLIPFIIGIIPTLLMRYKLNGFAFGEEEAKALGLNTKRISFVYIVCSTLLTASSVAVGGMIGWVGLVIPHLARMLVGPNFKYLLPASVLLGGAYLLLIDDLSRTIFSVEIPLSILTSIIGAPFFIYLLKKGKRSWE